MPARLSPGKQLRPSGCWESLCIDKAQKTVRKAHIKEGYAPAFQSIFAATSFTTVNDNIGNILTMVGMEQLEIHSKACCPEDYPASEEPRR